MQTQVELEQGLRQAALELRRSVLELRQTLLELGKAVARALV